MKLTLLAATSWLMLGSSASAQATHLNGSSLLNQSTDSSSSVSTPSLNRGGYLDTNIPLAAPSSVTANVRAEDIASSRVSSHMSVVIANSNTRFDVKPGANN